MRDPKSENIIIPDFSIQEITQYFNDLQIPLTPSDLQKPTPMPVQSFYETILEIYPGIKILDQLSQSDSTESHYLIILFCSLTMFFKNLGINNFSIRDLNMPDHKRLIMLLSSIVNFSMYRDSKRNVYLGVCADLNEKEEYYKDLDSKISVAEEVRLRSEQACLKIDEEMLRFEDVVLARENVMREKARVLRERMEIVEEMRRENDELGDKSSTNQLNLVNYKKEFGYLKTQVVSDPKKFMELLGEMKTMVVKEKEYVKALESDCNEKKTGMKMKGEIVERMRRNVEMARMYKTLSGEHVKKGDSKMEWSRGLLDREKTISKMMNVHSVTKKKIGIVQKKIDGINEKMKSHENEYLLKREGVNKQMCEIDVIRMKLKDDEENRKREFRLMDNEENETNNKYMHKYNDVKIKINTLREAMVKYYKDSINRIN